MELWWILQELVTDRSSTHASLNLLIIDSSLNMTGLWIELRNGNKSTYLDIPYQILCKAEDLNRLQILGKGTCLNSNRTAQQLQMSALKCLETISGIIMQWFWIDCHESLQQDSSTWIAMFEIHVKTHIDFFSNLLLKIIM